MGVDIYVPSGQVWDFFTKNRPRLRKEMVCIAENKDTGYAVYLTEDFEHPTFYICKDNHKPEFEEYAYHQSDCTEVASRLYAHYLLPEEVNDEIDPDNTLFQQSCEYETVLSRDVQDEIYEREDALSLALCDFLSVVLRRECDPADVVKEHGADTFGDIMNSVLKLLSTQYNLEIYRPMMIDDSETGLNLYTEYPYDDNADYYVVE